jgi:peptide deformylase
MLQPLVLYSSNHNILRTKTKESDIHTDRENLEKLIVDMKDTLQSVGGLGLAANQLGRNESICLVKLDENIVTMVNPTIVNRGGEKKISIEGCLSLPDITTKVERHETVTVKFINPDAEWSEQEMVVDFPNSVVVQHEIDHLNGILMIDGLTPLQRNLISTKLKRVSRGNAEVSYVGMIWRDSQKSWSLVGPYHKLMEFYSYHSNGNLETNGDKNGIITQIDEKERREAQENEAGEIKEYEVSQNTQEQS